MHRDQPTEGFLARWGVALAFAVSLASLVWVQAPAYLYFIWFVLAAAMIKAKVKELINALVVDVKAADDHLAFVKHGTPRSVRYEDVMLVCEGAQPLPLFFDYTDGHAEVEYATLYLQRAAASKAWEKISFELPQRLVQAGEHPTLVTLRQRVTGAKREGERR